MELTISKIDDLDLFTGIAPRQLAAGKELEKEVLEVAAQEQLRIGQELHDGGNRRLDRATEDIRFDNPMFSLTTTFKPRRLHAAAHRAIQGAGRQRARLFRHGPRHELYDDQATTVGELFEAVLSGPRGRDPGC